MWAVPPPQEGQASFTTALTTWPELAGRQLSAGARNQGVRLQEGTEGEVDSTACRNQGLYQGSGITELGIAWGSSEEGRIRIDSEELEIRRQGESGTRERIWDVIMQRKGCGTPIHRKQGFS